MPQDTGVAAWPVNDFDLTDSVGRYVRLTIDSNHGDSFRTKFGEIAFDVSSAAVPEPTSFAFLATAGLALVVRRLRPKNRKQAPV